MKTRVSGFVNSISGVSGENCLVQKWHRIMQYTLCPVHFFSKLYGFRNT